MLSTRPLFASLLAAVVLGAGLAELRAQVVPTQASEGTTLVIAGSGFGAKKPSAYLESSTTTKHYALKVVSFTDTTLTATVKKTPPGTWDVVVKPKAKGSQPIVIANGLQVRLPEFTGLLPVQAAAGATLVIEGHFFGTKKGSVKLGGKSAKITTWTDTSITLLVPKLQPGNWDLLLKNRIGSVSEPCVLLVPGLGGLASTNCPDRVSAQLGADAFLVTGFPDVFILTATQPQPLLIVTAVSMGAPRRQVQLVIPFDVGNGQPGGITGVPGGFVRVEEGAGPFDPDNTVWTTEGQGDDYSFVITGVGSHQVTGTFTALLTRVQGLMGDPQFLVQAGGFRVTAGP